MLGGEGGRGAGRYPILAVAEVEVVPTDVALKSEERRSATLLLGLRSGGEAVVKVLLLRECLCAALLDPLYEQLRRLP